MTDRKMSPEIEDVLASIRRLVSQDTIVPNPPPAAIAERQSAADAPRAVAASPDLRSTAALATPSKPQTAMMSAPVAPTLEPALPVAEEADPLVLTPALRVEEEPAAPAMPPVRSAPQVLRRDDLGAELSRLEDTIAELEAAVGEQAGFEPEEGDRFVLQPDPGYVADVPEAGFWAEAEDPLPEGWSVPGADIVQIHAPSQPSAPLPHAAQAPTEPVEEPLWLATDAEPEALAPDVLAPEVVQAWDDLAAPGWAVDDMAPVDSDAIDEIRTPIPDEALVVSEAQVADPVLQEPEAPTDEDLPAPEAVAEDVAADQVERPVVPDMSASPAQGGGSHRLHLQDAPASQQAFQSPAAVTEPEEDVSLFAEGPEAAIDEEALRQLIAEIIRQELQGTLGERITRNVRRLVRQEIQRALSTQDLE